MRTRRRHRRTARPARARRGISLVEMLIAIVMITVGVIGLLGSAGSVATQLGGGVRQTLAASVAQARIDSLTSLSCAQLATSGVASGSTTHRGITEKWSVTDGRHIKSIRVEIGVPRRVKPLVYTTVIPCRD